MKAISTLLFCISVALCAFSPAPEAQWELIGQQDGVAFYVTHLPSASGETINTIVKAKNLNAHTVRISFTPSISCDGLHFQDRPVENTYLDADSDLSLYTYKVCQNSTNVAVKILKVSVVKAK